MTTRGLRMDGNVERNGFKWRADYKLLAKLDAGANFDVACPSITSFSGYCSAVRTGFRLSCECERVRDVIQLK